MSADNPILENFSLKSYLSADHIWVSKTGMGVGVGVDPGDVQRLGWVDAALAEQGEKRQIRVFTRHYQAAMTLAEQNDLIVTLPTRATHLKQGHPRVVIREAPFVIPPLELKMAWSPCSITMRRTAGSGSSSPALPDHCRAMSPASHKICEYCLSLGSLSSIVVTE